MRTVIHLVNNFGLGGTERQLLTLLGGLDRRYWRSMVGCHAKVGPFLADVRRCTGLEPMELPLRGTLASPNSLWQALRLSFWVRRERASLIHAHDFYSNVIGLLARMMGAPARLIVSRRDMGHWLSPTRRRLLAAVSRRADAVLANADAVRRQVLQDGVAGEDVVVVHNGIDLEMFDEQAREGLQHDVPGLGAAPTVVHVANMNHPNKGHDVLLDAAAKVRARMPSARWVLVGDGPLRPALERRAAQLRLDHLLTFLGRRRDVGALLSRCTVAVSASYAEGLSNAVLESMAARLPVVATRVGGSGELVTHGLCGYLVQPGDADEMAERVLSLLHNVALARKLGEEGRRRVEERFTQARAAERVTELYEALLERRAPGLPMLGAPVRAAK